MKDIDGNVPMKLLAPTSENVDYQLAQVQRMFHRSLASWASDVLLLKQARLHCMAWPSPAQHAGRSAGRLAA